MVKFIIVIVFTFCFGIYVGERIKTKAIEERVEYLNGILALIKLKNNEMVNNFSKMYSMTDHNDEEFTEIDEMLMSMWMD